MGGVRPCSIPGRLEKLPKVGEGYHRRQPSRHDGGDGKGRLEHGAHARAFAGRYGPRRRQAVQLAVDTVKGAHYGILETIGSALKGRHAAVKLADTNEDVTVYGVVFVHVEYHSR